MTYKQTTFKPNRLSLTILILASSAFSSTAYTAIIESETSNSNKSSPSLEKTTPPFFNFNNDSQYISNLLSFTSHEEEIKKLIKRGLNNIKSGNKEQGIKDLEKVWALRPNNAATAVVLTKLYNKDKKFQQSLNLANKLKINTPNKPEPFIIEGFTYQGLNDAKKSKTAFQQALEIDPGNPIASASLADLALHNNNIQQAKKLYNNVLKFNPGNIRTLILMARLEASLGNSKQTKQLIAQAIKKYPKTGHTHNNFSQLYSQFKLYSLALKEIEKAVQLEPKNSKYKFNQAKILALNKDYNTAQNILTKLSAEFPKKSEPLELLGKIAIDQKQAEIAVKQFQKAYSLNAQTSLVIQLTQAQLLAQQKAEALNTLSEHLNRFPADNQTRTLYAEQLRKQGFQNKAIQQYQEIIHQQPEKKHLGIRNNLASQLAQKGEINLALEHIQKAHKLAPQEPNIMDTYAVILLKKARYKEAYNLLLKATKKLPKNLDIHFHLTQSLLGLNKNKEALDLLHTLIQKKGPFTERQQAEILLKELTQQQN